MAVTAGALSIVKVTATQAQLLSAAATGGTGPYTYQWYVSFSIGFTAGTSYLIPGATTLAYTYTGMLPATDYYFAVIATDTGAGSATSTSSTLTVLTNAGTQQEINQFQQTPTLGQITSSLNTGTRSAVVDGSYSTTSSFPPGTALKQVNADNFTAGEGLNTIPHVVPCTSATADTVFGFAQYSMKDQVFITGSPLEASQSGNTQWLMATASGNAGAPAMLDVTIPGGVTPITGNSDVVVGNFKDQPTVGNLVRVAINLVPRTTA